jgi:hypothetical protein
MKQGLRHDTVLPIPSGIAVATGDHVIFVEATTDPFGVPSFVRGRDFLSVVLTKVKEQERPWAGRWLHYIAWDPD